MCLHRIFPRDIDDGMQISSIANNELSLCTGLDFCSSSSFRKMIGKIVGVAGVTSDFQLHALYSATGVKTFAYSASGVCFCILLSIINSFMEKNGTVYNKHSLIGAHIWLSCTRVARRFQWHTQRELIPINDLVDRKCKFHIINFGFTDKWMPDNY